MRHTDIPDYHPSLFPSFHSPIAPKLIPPPSSLHSLYVYNKIDSISLEFLDQLAREPNTVVMSCEMDLGVQDVVERCWKELRLIRVYTKR